MMCGWFLSNCFVHRNSVVLGVLPETGYLYASNGCLETAQHRRSGAFHVEWMDTGGAVCCLFEVRCLEFVYIVSQTYTMSFSSNLIPNIFIVI